MRDFAAHKADGTEPVRELESTFKTDMRESWPNDVGIVPEIELELRTRDCSLLKYPTLSGMVPTRPKPANDTDFTLSLMHMTPPQLDIDPVQIDTVGVLPLQFQPPRPEEAGLNTAAKSHSAISA